MKTNDAIDQFVRSDRIDTANAVAELAQAPRRGLLVHIHIPKCAGMTINQLLKSNFADDFLPVYSPVPRSSFSNEELFAFSHTHPNINALASHSIRRFPKQFPSGRVPLYFTFLREPKSWLLSNYSYLIKNWKNLSPQSRETLPIETPEMTTRELATILLNRPAPFQVGKSNIVNYFAEPWAEDQISNGFQLTDWTSQQALEIACHQLDRFFFVGLVEQLPESMSRLQKQLAKFGIRFPKMEIGHENSSAEAGGDRDWINAEDSIGRLALERIADDVKLYEHAKSLFEGKTSNAL